MPGLLGGNKSKISSSVVLLLAACAGAPYMVETEGALQRTVERVVTRHDGYVSRDDLGVDGLSDALGESWDLLSLSRQPEVSGSRLAAKLAPVAERHDAYVSADADLDPLERDIYLQDTASLRSILATAEGYESQAIRRKGVKRAPTKQ